MHNGRKPITILVAEDDVDDQLLIKDAFAENQVASELHFVNDGEQLLAYLRREGEFERLKDQRLPGLILLDLYMPKKDGREALQEIKSDPELRDIPIVALSTPRGNEDVIRAYGDGVASFVVKPANFEELVDFVSVFVQYWLETVELPTYCTYANH